MPGCRKRAPASSRSSSSGMCRSSRTSWTTSLRPASRTHGRQGLPGPRSPSGSASRGRRPTSGSAAGESGAVASGRSSSSGSSGIERDRRNDSRTLDVLAEAGRPGARGREGGSCRRRLRRSAAPAEVDRRKRRRHGGGGAWSRRGRVSPRRLRRGGGPSTTGRRGRGQEPQGPCGRGGGARPRLSADEPLHGGTWAVRRLRGRNRLAPLGSDALLGRRAALPHRLERRVESRCPLHEGDGLAAAFRRARAGRPVCRGADRHRRRSPRSLARCRNCRRDLPGGDDDRHLRAAARRGHWATASSG